MQTEPVEDAPDERKRHESSTVKRQSLRNLVPEIELPDSEKITEVPITMPDPPLSDRNADTIPAPPDLDLDE